MIGVPKTLNVLSCQRNTHTHISKKKCARLILFVYTLFKNMTTQLLYFKYESSSRYEYVYGNMYKMRMSVSVVKQKPTK